MPHPSCRRRYADLLIGAAEWSAGTSGIFAASRSAKKYIAAAALLARAQLVNAGAHCIASRTVVHRRFDALHDLLRRGEALRLPRDALSELANSSGVAPTSSSSDRARAAGALLDTTCAQRERLAHQVARHERIDEPSWRLFRSDLMPETISSRRARPRSRAAAQRAAGAGQDPSLTSGAEASAVDPTRSGSERTRPTAERGAWMARSGLLEFRARDHLEQRLALAGLPTRDVAPAMNVLPAQAARSTEPRSPGWPVTARRSRRAPPTDALTEGCRRSHRDVPLHRQVHNRFTFAMTLLQVGERSRTSCWAKRAPSEPPAPQLGSLDVQALPLDEAHDLGQALPGLEVAEHERAATPLRAGVLVHDFE